MLLASSLLSVASLCAEERGPFFFVAPLYWQAEGNGLAFAVTSDTTTGLAKSSINNLDFDWDFGFQVGLGHRIPHDLWSFSLGLKHIHTNAHGLVEGKAVFPTWCLPESSGLFATKAHAHWRLHLGLLDFLVVKECAITRFLTLVPHFGLRSAWIRQKYNLEYTGGTLKNEVAMRMKNKFWGIGPTFGVEGNWKMVRYFSLFSEVLVSLLYGQFYLHQDEDVFKEKTKLLGLHSRFKNIVGTCDLSVGLRWEAIYQGALKRVRVDLAWDQVFLYQQNQLVRFTGSGDKGLVLANQGDLSLHGIRLAAGFEF